ncbi:efflux RND transporter periplasmic adaptor subunit [Bacillus sp. ISL-18]|uniref:efflux RND transporter periplasmic adaptor subunit n=1 Tax=Bacillus sp. ISL-18 TaxID=2819118 RepID=UPI001BEB23BC|nr:efflux RND transporter periplasmic adaptor subunit [Bacillus sp. ISL-18]MBT2658268.1 efflux RND transporter periplasmic adaptor subunit [Bacillus sp. ISL-18]
MKKWILIAVAAVVVSFSGYQWYAVKTSAKTTSSQERTAVVKKGTLAVNISGSGTVQAVTSQDIMSTFNNDEIDEVLVGTGEKVNKGDELITFTDGSDPITAPAAGKITSLSVSAGDSVTSGQVVAHVTDYSGLETAVQIDELDISKIQKGQMVNLKVSSFPDEKYTGKVTDISKEGTSSNGISTFTVTIMIDKIANLKVGMSVEASILTESKPNVIYVPLDAVHSSNGKKYVNVVSSDDTSNTTKKTVKTGIANEDYVEITEGLAAGDTVLLPKLAKASTITTTTQGNSLFSGMGGTSSMRGMYRSSGTGQFSGRSRN